MIELLESNWPLVAIALLIGLAVAWYVFHAGRRTRVTGASRDVLDEGAAPAARNSALIDAPPAAREPVAVPPGATEILAGTGVATAAAAESAQARAQPSAPAQAGDDLSRIKGLGPKLVALLADLGVTRFDQIAAWDEAEIDRIDSRLGRFQGRIRRDDWVGQAKLLGTGDVQGYADKYGRLG